MLPTNFADWTAYIAEVNAGTRPAPSLDDLAQIARNMSVDVPGATGPTLLYSGNMGDTRAYEAANSLESQHPSVRIVDRTEAIRLMNSQDFMAAVQAQVHGNTEAARKAFI